MPRFKATIEFDCGEGNDAELVLKSYGCVSASKIQSILEKVI